MRSACFSRRRLGLALSLCLILAAMTVATHPAAAQWGVSLLDDKSLIGWTYGESGTEGWAIEEGQLSGSANAATLLSGYTAGDFELRFNWQVEDEGVIELQLPKVPCGPGLTLSLCEGDGCGRLTDGEKQIESGTKIDTIADGSPHRAAVKLEAGRLTLSIDGKTLYETKLAGAADRRFGLGLAVTKGVATIADLRAVEPTGEPIFNGKNLEGWQCRQRLDAWKADGGELCLATPGGGSYLQTSKLFSNFTLSCQVLIRKGGNSGFGIRTMPLGWPSGDGMEVQILDNASLGKSSFMAVYGNMPPIAIGHKSEEYNDIVIKADGWMISAWINGKLIQHLNTKDHPELRHRNLSGWIGFQDHGAWVRIRNLRVLESPEGEGLDAWCAPRTPLATATIVDRMMNTENLSVDQSIRTASVVTEVKAEDDVLLAELNGPGAVTRIANLGNKGRLAFYFDGEEEPRLKFLAKDIHHHLPRIGESVSPQPICVPFAQSLKIVLVGGEETTYAIDAVKFPESMEIASLGDGLPDFPRGWLDAAVYRSQKFRFGCPREYDRLERIDVRGKRSSPVERSK